MPNKWLNQKGIEIKKQKYKLSNWSDYNKSLKNRGDIDIWLSLNLIKHWYYEERIYDGTGSSKHYTDDAIIACHEIRQVYKLPLRQTEGFINSLFRLMRTSITCPNYTTLSKRLKQLNIKCPRYTKSSKMAPDIAAIAIDSTGLKRFGPDEWHVEKHRINARRYWRKAHFGIDESHIIQAATLTDRFSHDDEVIDSLLSQIHAEVHHFSADGAYDETPVYDKFLAHSPDADIVIPPAKNAVLNIKSHTMRNRNVSEIAVYGRMAWQKKRRYGRRNISELGIQRYKRMLGRSMHASKFERQQQALMIGCEILNKMTHLGMPESFKTA